MLRKVIEALEGFEAYVVGGAVRDLLLGKASGDLDLLLPRASFQAGLGRISAALGTDPYALNQAHSLYRFELKSDRITVDAGPLSGPLEEDLRRRDFTFNAMALPLVQFASGDLTGLVDPLGGRDALSAGVLRLASSQSLRADPVRILRAGRFAVELGLVPDAVVTAASAQSAHLLRYSPGERLWAEFVKILRLPASPQIIHALEQNGSLAVILPELEAERGVIQGRHHSYPVYEHSLAVFSAYVGLWHNPECLSGELRQSVEEYLALMDDRFRAVCLLGGLIHDIGKPAARRERENGRVSFYRHEHMGAAMVPPISQRLRLSRHESRSLSRFVRYHTLQAQFARVQHPSDRQLHLLGRRLGDLSVPMSLFSLADLMGKTGDQGQNRDYAQMLEALQAFLSAWFYRYGEVMAPQLPVDGDDIASHLGIQPGRWLSETLDYLLELEAGGAGLSRDQALREAARFTSAHEKKK